MATSALSKEGKSINFRDDEKRWYSFQRLNTFITRAMELLIVISSEGLLQKMADSPANEYIEYVFVLLKRMQKRNYLDFSISSLIATKIALSYKILLAQIR